MRTCSASRSCGPGRGSAATATATRTSPQTSSGWPPLERRLHRARALLRRNHRAGGGAVDVGAAGQGQRRIGGAGRRVPRARACRRTVPARAAGHPRQAHRDRASRSWTDQPEHELDLGLERYERLRSCWPTSTSSTGRCAPTAARCWPTTGWRDCGKPCAPSVSTCPAWIMRQNSDVHEEVVAELLAWAGVHPDYRSLPEPDRVELLVAELGTRRPLDRRRRRALRAGAQGTRHRAPPPPAPSRCSARSRCRTTSSRCASRCPTCSRRRCC